MYAHLVQGDTMHQICWTLQIISVPSAAAGSTCGTCNGGMWITGQGQDAGQDGEAGELSSDFARAGEERVRRKAGQHSDPGII